METEVPMHLLVEAVLVEAVDSSQMVLLVEVMEVNLDMDLFLVLQLEGPHNMVRVKVVLVAALEPTLTIPVVALEVDTLVVQLPTTDQTTKVVVVDHSIQERTQ